MCRRSRGECTLLACLMGAVALVPSLARAGGSPQAVRSAAVRDLVHEALHREIYGLAGDRQRLLEEASQLDPQYEPAKWHQGYVRFLDAWVPAEAVAERASRHRSLIAYQRVRAKHPDTVPGHMAVAAWCRDHDLADQERAHLTRVLDLDPDHAIARQRLGFRMLDGRWAHEAVIREARERREAERQWLAQWRPRLEELRKALQQRSASERAAAAESLRAIRDPRAIPALEAVFFEHSLETALLAIEALAEMPEQEATQSLVRYAVFSPWPAAREAAAKGLEPRPPESYVPLLLSQLHTPAVSRAAVVPAGSGRLVYRHGFLREGQDQRELLILDTEYRRVALPEGDGRETLVRALGNSWATANAREYMLARQNQVTRVLNDRIVQALQIATGQTFSSDPQTWWDWWQQEAGAATQGEKQTRAVRQAVQLAVVDRAQLASAGGDSGQRSSPAPRRVECFAAGTLVWTATGRLPIEEVRVGDLVLSQNVDTGELALKPVLRTTVRPPEPLMEVQVGEQTLRTTPGHLFWISGRGWSRARQLESGMQVHGVTGAVAMVRAVPLQTAAPTYNVAVADFQTYFVGQPAVLSHDVSEQRPTATVVPGLPGR